MACRAVLAHACVRASLLSLSLAVLLAHALERWQFWSRQLLTICVRLALILTPVVTGYVLLLVFGQTASVGLPLMIPLVSFSVSTYGARDPFGDRGGGPQIRRGGHHDWRQSDLGFFDRYDALAGGRLGGGMVLAFAKAMKEFGASIIDVANIPGQTQTLPSAIYAFL